MNSLLCLFQCKNKFCSNTLCTDHIDVLSMCMKNLFDDCQTKAGSFLILASGSINLIKSFPDLLETCLWNSNAMIFDRNKDLAVFFGSLKCNRGIVRAEFGSRCSKGYTAPVGSVPYLPVPSVPFRIKSVPEEYCDWYRSLQRRQLSL